MPVDFDIDDEVDKLHGKVSMLKQMTGAIHDESNIRGKLIDKLEQSMASAGSAMKDAKRKIDKAFKHSGSGHLGKACAKKGMNEAPTSATWTS